MFHDFLIGQVVEGLKKQRSIIIFFCWSTWNLGGKRGEVHLSVVRQISIGSLAPPGAAATVLRMYGSTYGSTVRTVQAFSGAHPPGDPLISNLGAITK